MRVTIPTIDTEADYRYSSHHAVIDDGESSPSDSEFNQTRHQREVEQEIDEIKHLTTEIGQQAKRSLLGVAFAPSCGLLALWIFLAIMNHLSFNTAGGMGHTFPLATMLWFAGHLLPITINNVTISFLPLLPALLTIVWVRVVTKRAADEPSASGDTRLVLATSVAGSILVAVFLYFIARFTFRNAPIEFPSIFRVIISVGLIHACGALWGIAKSARGLGLLMPQRCYNWLSGPHITAINAALRKVIACVLGISVLITLIRIHSVWELWSSSAGDYLPNIIPLNIISLAYVPNFIILFIAFSFGITVNYGVGSVDFFHITNNPQLPLVPISALVPHDNTQQWWQYLIAIPLVAGIILGVVSARTPKLLEAFTGCCYASGVLALGLTLCCFMASGDVGLMGRVGSNPLHIAGFSFLGLLVTSSITAIIYQQISDASEVVSYRYRHKPERLDDSGYLESETVSEEECEKTFDLDNQWLFDSDLITPAEGLLLEAPDEEAPDEDALDEGEDLELSDEELVFEEDQVKKTIGQTVSQRIGSLGNRKFFHSRPKISLPKPSLGKVFAKKSHDEIPNEASQIPQTYQRPNVALDELDVDYL